MTSDALLDATAIDRLLDAAAIMDPIWDRIGLAALDALLSRPSRQRSWNQRDVTRALRAAMAAGVLARVDINLNGTLSVVPISTFPLTQNEADDIVARLA